MKKIVFKLLVAVFMFIVVLVGGVSAVTTYLTEPNTIINVLGFTVAFVVFYLLFIIGQSVVRIVGDLINFFKGEKNA